MCVLVWVNGSEECLIPWTWSHRHLWTVWHRCWEWNSGPLQEQLVLLPDEHLFSPQYPTIMDYVLYAPKIHVLKPKLSVLKWACGKTNEVMKLVFVYKEKQDQCLVCLLGDKTTVIRQVSISQKGCLIMNSISQHLKCVLPDQILVRNVY